jgi:hypothetical protein
MDRYAFLDIETTGENVVKNKLIAFAVAIINSETGEIEDSLEVFVKPPAGEDYVWEQRCLDEFWHRNDEMRATKDALLAKVASEGVSPQEAMATLVRWINENRTPEFLKSLILMSDTAGYDVGWINYLLGLYGFKSLNYIVGDSYKPIFDSTSFNRGVGRKLPSDGYWGAESAAFAALKASEEVMNDNPYKADHFPLNDAKSLCYETFKIHRLIKQRRDGGN